MVSNSISFGRAPRWGAAGRSDKAVKDLLAQMVPRVYRFALRLTGDAHAAEELAQETFLRAWRNRHRLRDVEAARSWLFRIAVNLWRDGQRRRKLGGGRPVSLTDQDVLSCGPRPDQAIAEQEEVRLVIERMDSLPARQRQVLYLHAIEEMKHDEIGRVLGIRGEAVKASLSLARKTMRRELKEAAANRRGVR